MNLTHEERPSANVLLQRVRNRIIDYLEVAASLEEQKKYQLAVPAISVPSEVINQWGDWVSPAWRRELIAPVFSEAERDGIDAFCRIWESVTVLIPDPLPALNDVMGMTQWQVLCDGAHALADVFSVRGKSSETHDDC